MADVELKITGDSSALLTSFEQAQGGLISVPCFSRL